MNQLNLHTPANIRSISIPSQSHWQVATWHFEAFNLNLNWGEPYSESYSYFESKSRVALNLNLILKQNSNP